MSVFGKPGYLKTYGRQKRRVEQWFSPDLRKQAFSFSSTLSSEESVIEQKRKTNKKKSIASASSRTLRVAKQNALKALLKELESDEESDFIPETATRRKPNSKLIKTAVTSAAPGMQSSTSKKKENVRKHTRKRRKIQPDLGNSENENATHISHKCSSTFKQSRSSHSKHIKQEESADPPHLDRFVTQRKKVLDLNSNNPAFKENLGVSSNSFDTSKDLICGVPSFSHHVTNRKRPTTQQEIDTKPPVVWRSSACNRSRTVLCEVSFNDVEERMMSCKHPLLSSTPSLERNLHCLEPSISELSPFSFDDFDKPCSINQTTASGLKSTARKKGAKHTPTDETVQLMEEQSAVNSVAKYANAPSPLKHQTFSNTEFVSTPLSMRLAQLKERAVIMLGQSDDNRKREVEKTYLPRSDGGPATSVTAISSCPSKQTCQLSSDYAMSDASIQPLHLTSSFCPSSFSSVSSFSAPPTCEISSSLQAQIDHLKGECLSSCLTVRLHRLDLSTIRKAQEETTESLKSQVASPLPLKTEGSQNTRNLKNVPCVEDTKSVGPSPDQEMSGSFMLSSISPAPITAPGKMPVKKENVSCSSRKVCVSGLNSSRWSKRGTCEQNRKKRTKLRGCSSSDLLPTGAESYMGESACDWLQSSRVNGLPKTPLRVELLNLTDFLTGFTPDSLTTHTWGRLKAALSVHKKMTAFPTPQRLALSKLKHPGLVDTSLDLFGTPVCKQASSRLLQSSINSTSMSSHYEDISDAEKVYQECQQDGPILFDDCIPPERMKHCIKIGEGTFGEVFSMFNDARQTVALKIIPVEGHQKVNGEPQKSFGEILHEIIISKELSELNAKEHNKTNGFIGLINLHCVRGCYPGALLKAWDKFDQEKGSDNDRPDFFGKEQLFLILEFEFGGSDLENMNGKLSSMAQAKSVLHQVTAALAVAEEALSFEHRDLHWGNILVKNTKQKHIQFILNDSVHSIETRGVHVNIIDYSLSRLEIDGLTVSCDIANEEELFMGQGDYQFEIYRLMKSENNNCWADYNPHSNVLWLHYLADKLLTMKYKSKIQTSQQKALKSSLKSFHSEILNYRSAKDVLLHCPLLK